ncbi:hypothetical protein Scep_017213 [Stephania cephalantha]|uniref:Uncharacterized protein n=1 Tax=Stephania cephalantha TaxID=152367 RepID=A0AAP0IPM8_9MAGN
MVFKSIKMGFPHPNNSTPKLSWSGRKSIRIGVRCFSRMREMIEYVPLMGSSSFYVFWNSD